jgi:hypothetical protein
MSESMDDLSAIGADDQYLDFIGIGIQPDDDTLTRILGDWRDEVRSGE